VGTREARQPRAQFRESLGVIGIDQRLRVTEEGVADEVVLLTVVPTDKADRQRPVHALFAGAVNAALLFVDELARIVIPKPKVLVSKSAPLFRGELGEYGVDADLDWCSTFVEVTPEVEVVLVDDRATIQTLRAEHEVKRLTDGRLPGVIAADEQCVRPEMDLAVFYTPEVLNP